MTVKRFPRPWYKDRTKRASTQLNDELTDANYAKFPALASSDFN
jgi:hypothetical protein